MLVEFQFVIPRIEMADRARAEDDEHLLGLRRKMRLPRGEQSLARKHLRQRDATGGRGEVREKRAATEVLMGG